MLKGILLDLDNTLYEYQPCNHHAVDVLMNRISKDFGISIETAEKEYSRAREVVKSDLRGSGASHSRLLYIQKMTEFIAGRSEFRKILEYHDLFWESYFAKMALFEGVTDFLETSKQKNLKIAVVSDLTAHIQMRKIFALGINRYIDYFVSSEEAGIEKPAPYIFLLALDKMNLRRDEVVMIGDDKVKDITGANNLGIEAILATPDFFPTKSYHQIFERL